MKIALRYFTLAIGLLLAFSVQAQKELHPQYESISPGLDYAHIRMTNWNDGEPQSIHVARMERGQKDLHLASGLAHNEVFRTAPVSVIAKEIPASIGQSLAAINTGFCINVQTPYYGGPRGLVITEGEVISEPSKYSFWLNEDGEMNCGQVEANFTAILPGGRTVPIGLNRQCNPDEVVLFTHRLGSSTRATNNLELILEDAEGAALFWRASQKYSFRVKGLNPGGNTALSNNVAILSFGSDVSAELGEFAPGDKVVLDLATIPSLHKVRTACQTIFPIVRHGELVTEFDTRDYLKQRHPRTAIGFNARHFYMVVVDGRKPGISTGMLPDELGQLMVLLGCTEAMNMDGGGSTTFWSDGHVRNSVAGSRERDRSDALVVVKRSPDELSGGGR
ncbi:MAG: phosphodiester glycosidase family protein [Verrucomicrobia bacterium]|nr:phosphodiester glycosidase family protein [Verrucomicrobiota bacterium]